MYGDIKTNSNIEKSLGNLIGMTSVQLKTFLIKMLIENLFGILPI